MAISNQLDDLLWRVVVFARMGWVAANNGNAEEAADLAWHAARLRADAERIAAPELVAEILDVRFQATYRHGPLEACS